VGRAYSCWMLNWWCITWPVGFKGLYTEEQICACFTGWQKAFDRVNWTELMQILKGISMNWRERRFISKMYVEQSVQLRLEHGKKTSVKNGREVIIFNYALQPFKAYCAIWVRRSNFRHQASPRVSPREITQRRKWNCGREMSGNFT
jgi:hypothetical protein